MTADDPVDRGGQQAVRRGSPPSTRLSFDVASGSITGLIGPNGAGKTTMFNLISGFLRPERGVIHFDGWRCDGRLPHALAAAGLVRNTFQIPRVLTRMTVLENMMLAGMEQPGRNWSTPRGRGRRGASEIREQARGLLDLVRLSRLAGDYAGTLSGGQRKLLEFGRALMTRPRMVLLDEPMAGSRRRWRSSCWSTSSTCGRPAARPSSSSSTIWRQSAVSDRIVVMDEGAQLPRVF